MIHYSSFKDIEAQARVSSARWTAGCFNKVHVWLDHFEACEVNILFPSAGCKVKHRLVHFSPVHVSVSSLKFFRINPAFLIWLGVLDQRFSSVFSLVQACMSTVLFHLLFIQVPVLLVGLFVRVLYFVQILRTQYFVTNQFRTMRSSWDLEFMLFGNR